MKVNRSLATGHRDVSLSPRGSGAKRLTRALCRPFILETL